MRALGFTLVELIVVIVILAILATIAFLSFGTYSNNARDSKRISDVSNIRKGLGILNTTSGTYPMPESSITVMSGSAVMGFQGEAGSQVLGTIKMSLSAKDPSSNEYYSYLINAAKDGAEVMGLLEDGNSLNATVYNPFESAFAENTQMIPYVSGDPMGIIVFSDSKKITPIQKYVTGTGYDIGTAGSGVTAIASTKGDAIKDFAFLETTYKTPMLIKKITAVATLAPDVQLIFGVGQSIGAFKKNGLDLTLMNISAGTDTLLMANQVDVKVGGSSSALGLYLGNQEIRLVGTLYRDMVLGVYSRYPISNISSVKKLGVSKIGLEPHYKGLAVLKSLGADISGITPVVIQDEATRYQKLVSGELDAIVTSQFGKVPDGSPYYNYLPTTKIEGYYFPVSVLSSDSIMCRKSDELKRFMQASIDTIKYMKANRLPTVSTIQSFLSVDSTMANYIYDKFLDASDGQDYLPKQSDFESMRTMLLQVLAPTNPQRNLNNFVYPNYVQASKR